MAMTETRPTDTSTGEGQSHPVPTGIAGVIGGGDHKTTGRLFIGASMLFGLVGLVMSALSWLASMGDDPFISADLVVRFSSLSQIGLVVLVAIPLFVGLGLLLVPLQVGSSTIAFPRAAQLAFWTWFTSGLLMSVVWFVDGGPAGTGTKSVDLGYLGLIATVLGLLLASICIVTTVTTMRTEGMGLDRVPFFSWAMFVATSAWLLTLPVLVANTVLVYVDTHNGAVLFSDSASSWNAIIWAALLPQVYVCAIPLLGVLGDAVLTATGRRTAMRGTALVGIGAFGVLSIGAWAQFAQVEDLWTNPLFVGVNFLVLLPVLAVLAVFGTSMKDGVRGVSTGLAGGLAALLVLLLATIAGALIAVDPLRITETGGALGQPVGLQGQANLVIAAALAGAIAAAFHWSPKLTGRSAPEGLGKLAALLALAGGVLWGVAPFVLGLQARFTGIADADDLLYVLAAAGAAALAAAVVVTVLGLLGSRGPNAEDNPVDGLTLEWTTTSPPAFGNFAEPARVQSPEPLLDPVSEEEAS